MGIGPINSNYGNIGQYRYWHGYIAHPYCPNCLTPWTSAVLLAQKGFKPSCVRSSSCSHLHAGAGWTGMGALSNGGMVEPGQGVNGTVLTNQAGMSTAGYPTH